MEPSSLPPPQGTLAAALQEDRGDLFSTTSVENRESPLYTGHWKRVRKMAVKLGRGFFERPRRADRIQECGGPGGLRVGRRDPLLRETIAKDVKARGGKGRDLTRRILYLPALIVAAVLLACAVVVIVVSEKAEATFPGKNGRIAYASYDAPFPKGDLEIYTINPDGSGNTQITHNGTYGLDPSCSPDGKRIVYAGQDGPKGGLEIYTINARGGDKFQVTHNDVDEEWPAYSPSGKRIAYTPIEGADGIYSIKVSGGGKTLVARNGGVPSYSPDGKRIAYECYGRPPNIDTDICTISVRREHKLPKFIPEKPL